MKRPVEDGLSLLVGAGVGMALMYLLDPDEGTDRREAIQRAAKDRLAQATHAASAGLGQLHDVVDRASQMPSVQMLAARAAEAAKGVYNDATGRANAAVSDYQNQASDTAQGFQDKFNGKLDELRGKAGDLRDAARSNYGKWLNRKSLDWGRDEDHHYIGQTACALGSLAVGASAVYLFDPAQGQQRRAQLIERTTHVVRETGDFFRKAGRRLVTRGRAVATDVADSVQDAVAGLQENSATAEDAPAVSESNQASMGT